MEGDNQNGNSWKTPPFRQKVVEQIKAAKEESSYTPVTKSEAELEAAMFKKARSKGEYLSLVARLILFMRNRTTVDPVMNHLNKITASTSPSMVTISDTVSSTSYKTWASSKNAKNRGSGNHRNKEDENLAKCEKILSSMVRLSVCLTTTKQHTVRTLVQNLIDGSLSPTSFTKDLEKVMGTSPQPHLASFLQRYLEQLRHRLHSGQFHIEGIVTASNQSMPVSGTDGSLLPGAPQKRNGCQPAANQQSNGSIAGAYVNQPTTSNSFIPQLPSQATLPDPFDLVGAPDLNSSPNSTSLNPMAGLGMLFGETFLGTLDEEGQEGLSNTLSQLLSTEFVSDSFLNQLGSLDNYADSVLRNNGTTMPSNMPAMNEGMQPEPLTTMQVVPPQQMPQMSTHQSLQPPPYPSKPTSMKQEMQSQMLMPLTNNNQMMQDQTMPGQVNMSMVNTLQMSGATNFQPPSQLAMPGPISTANQIQMSPLSIPPVQSFMTANNTSSTDLYLDQCNENNMKRRLQDTLCEVPEKKAMSSEASHVKSKADST